VYSSVLKDEDRVRVNSTEPFSPIMVADACRWDHRRNNMHQFGPDLRELYFLLNDRRSGWRQTRQIGFAERSKPAGNFALSSVA